MDKQKINELKKPLGRIVESIRNYDVILWAGSGLSLYANYPSGEKLCNTIVDAAENKNEKDILCTYKNSLMDVSNEFAQIYSRDKLIQIIKDYFDVEPSVEPTVHKIISKIPQIDTIITTNYDHLFEIAYKNININVGTKLSKTIKGVVDLYKIHGDTSEPESIVITSIDYAKFYDKLDSILWNKVKGILAEKSVIFVGYSLEDKNIQDVFEKVISQIDVTDKDLYIVTPKLYEHKLCYLNTICKTTHIPLTGEEFFEYIEKEIRKHIVEDAVKKKVPVDEAYKLCREHGITPTIVNEPYGEETKPIVAKVSLSPELLINSRFIPFGRGADITSNPETVEAMERFFDDCDCTEVEIPAEDATIYQNINGIHIPETGKINGMFPSKVKLEKREEVEKLNLFIKEDESLNGVVNIKSLWGQKRNKETIELSCINILIIQDYEKSNYNFSFRYPHSSDDALIDLKRIKAWCYGSDLIFNDSKGKEYFSLNGSKNKEKIIDLVSFIEENLRLYNEIKMVEKDLGEILKVENELTLEEIQNIHRASSSLTPTSIKFMKDIPLKVGKITLKELDLYCNSDNLANIQITYSDILPEDNFTVLGKDIILGIRKIRIEEPYVINIDEAITKIKNNEDVVLQIGSKTQKAILEYFNPAIR